MITVAMATFPPRKEGLLRRVSELLPQCDRLCIYLNGYTEVPPELVDPKIEYVLAGTERDMGSQGKLYWLDTYGDDYYLTVDDDIHYPKGYVQFMIAACDRYKGRAVVSLHGGYFTTLDRGSIPFNRRAKDIRVLYNYAKRVLNDVSVHMSGNGCMICRPSIIGLTKACITGPLHSGDDEDLALWTQSHGVPAIVAAHPRDWLSADATVWPVGAMHTDIDKQKLSDTKLKTWNNWRFIYT